MFAPRMQDCIKEALETALRHCRAGDVEQYTDLTVYPSEGIRREYRRTVYSDGMVIYDRITETDNYYGCVELNESLYHEELSKAMKRHG